MLLEELPHRQLSRSRWPYLSRSSVPGWVHRSLLRSSRSIF